jgi:hypothetical protein
MAGDAMTSSMASAFAIETGRNPAEINRLRSPRAPVRNDAKVCVLRHKMLIS